MRDLVNCCIRLAKTRQNLRKFNLIGICLLPMRRSGFFATLKLYAQVVTAKRIRKCWLFGKNMVTMSSSDSRLPFQANLRHNLVQTLSNSTNLKSLKSTRSLRTSLWSSSLPSKLTIWSSLLPQSLQTLVANLNSTNPLRNHSRRTVDSSTLWHLIVTRQISGQLLKSILESTI